MAKASASTLVRRAAQFEKNKQPTIAKRLRKQAANMRAAERKAKRAKKGAAPKLLGRKHPAPTGQTVFSANAGAQDNGKTMLSYDGGSDSWKEVSRDRAYISDAEIDYLRIAAKSKVKEDGHDLFAIRLRGQLLDARIAGEKKSTAETLERIQINQEAQHINVVCAFLAEMNGLAGLNRGAIPRVVMISGYTLARVVDALRTAGYTEDGKEGIKRH